MTITQRKQLLRSEQIARLKQVSAQMRADYSAAIVAKLRSLPLYKQADAVCAFAPLLTEPDLSALYDDAIEAGKTVAFPRCSSDGTMDFYAVPPNWREHIVTNAFHVGQGDESCHTVVSTHTHQRLLLLVPALAYTPHRQRLGRGKAFYDRYIASHERSQFTYVGVCFSLQIELDIPYESHDMVVDIVMTETKNY